MDQSLAANFVPFRSQKWTTLANKKESLIFADMLWSDIIDFITPRAIVSIAEIPFNHLLTVLQNKGFKIVAKTKACIGWGNVTYSLMRLTFNNASIVVVRLPHLSTYKIFNRKQCEEPIKKFTSEIAAVINENVI